MKHRVRKDVGPLGHCAVKNFACTPEFRMNTLPPFSVHKNPEDHHLCQKPEMGIGQMFASLQTVQGHGYENNKFRNHIISFVRTQVIFFKTKTFHCDLTRRANKAFQSEISRRCGLRSPHSLVVRHREDGGGTYLRDVGSHLCTRLQGVI